MKAMILGIDLGTGGCKATLLSADGAFISDGYAEYKTYHPQIGWSEQKPADWFPAFLLAFQAALESGDVAAKHVTGLSLSASAHNAVLLDSAGAVLRDTIMWTDQRSVQESQALIEQHGKRIFEIGYQVPAPTWTLPQLMWLQKNEPEVFGRISRIAFIKDYVRYQLTGVWQTDYIEAQGSLLFDNATWEWSGELCALAGIRPSVLPAIHKPTDFAGRVTKEAAALTGIPEGTPVINGASDTALENYCVGAIHEGDCVVKIATASTVNTFQNEAHPLPGAMTYSQVVDGLWNTCLATSSAAASLRWYRDTFCNEELLQENEGGKNVYRLLDEEAMQVPPGAEGLYFHPYLTGERSPHWNAQLRGSFVGITARHTRGYFNRAILEGVAYSIKDNFCIAEAMQPIREVSLVGGGSKSALWSGILADVLNKPIIKYKKADSSYGAAMLAGVGIGAFESHEAAIRACTHEAERVLPTQENAEAYQKGFEIYQEIFKNLKNTYSR